MVESIAMALELSPALELGFEFEAIALELFEFGVFPPGTIATATAELFNFKLEMVFIPVLLDDNLL
jgi:predicted subunit of tRNA(5-methylaminomethyl-2-thiouridylate) methyltransferase